MGWFATGLASQISFLIASLNEDNRTSTELELRQVTKLDLLAIVLKKLIHQPNAGSILCEALKDSSAFSQGILETTWDFATLKLSVPEQIGLALALTDAEDPNLQRKGRSFCRAKIFEIYEISTGSAPTESPIEETLEFLGHSSGMTRHGHSFLRALQSLQLTPILQQENVNEVNCLSGSGIPTCPLLATATRVADVLQELGATRVADVLQELGDNCTVDIAHCKAILRLVPSITEVDVAQILGMVARTHHGLEDLQGVHCTFCPALCNGDRVSSERRLVTWDVDVLLDSIHQLAPHLSWGLVMEESDHHGGPLTPDQKFSFFLLLNLYYTVCQGHFLLVCCICFEPLSMPVATLCGHTFCWGHLYRWLTYEDGHDTCPVCATTLGDIEDDLFVIPLFESGDGSASCPDTPPRPSATLLRFVTELNDNFTRAYAEIQELDAEAESGRSQSDRWARRIIELERQIIELLHGRQCR